MLIDWFTVCAQALNFLILVWLMKRFLYQPVLDAIDARERGIAAELADADARKVEAARDSVALREKSAAFDAERAALLATATAAAEATRRELTDAARSAADALAAARLATLADDAKRLDQAICERATTEVFAIARRVLGDLAGASLDASACALFIQRLAALDGSARSDFAAALKSAPDAVLVRSAFELAPAERAALHDAIATSFAIDIALRFETAPALVGGIELSAQGQKFAWSIADYLATLESSVGELLRAPIDAAPAAPAAPTTPAAP